MSDPSRSGGLASEGGKDEVDRPIVALKFKIVSHQRTVGVAARVPRQRDGMEDKVSTCCGRITYSLFAVSVRNMTKVFASFHICTPVPLCP